MNDTITAIKGIQVGHAVLSEAPSGCTVLLPDGGAVAGVDIRGGAPGTYGTDAIHPLNLVDRIHGLFFSGGSAFGLGVGEGVKRFLHERQIGFESGHGKIPIVAGAIIFDLGTNKTGHFPDAELGYRACLNVSGQPVAEGCEGAGLGATVGKIYGLERGMKGGVGSVCIRGLRGLKVGALMVVNAFGTVVDPSSCRPLAGCRAAPDSQTLIDADNEMTRLTRLTGFPDGRHTIVGAVATNAALNKTQLTKVAQMAQDGVARTVYPAHTLYDGDTIFALSCGKMRNVEVTIIGALAARATAEAIMRAVRQARSMPGIPAFKDLGQDEGVRRLWTK